MSAGYRTGDVHPSARPASTALVVHQDAQTIREAAAQAFALEAIADVARVCGVALPEPGRYDVDGTVVTVNQREEWTL